MGAPPASDILIVRETAVILMVQENKCYTLRISANVLGNPCPKFLPLKRPEEQCSDQAICEMTITPYTSNFSVPLSLFPVSTFYLDSLLSLWTGLPAYLPTMRAYPIGCDLT